MTTVGKILVFMNLVFSLVVGAFAVMDYTARTHWSSQYEKVSAQYAAAAGTSAAYKAEAETLRKQQADLNEKLSSSGDPELKVARPEDAEKVAKKAAAMLSERANVIDGLKKQLEAKNKELTETKLALNQASAVQKVAVADVDTRSADVKKLVQQLTEARTQNNQLVLEKNKLRDDKTAAEIDMRAHKTRADQLATDNGRLEKLVGAMKAAGGNPSALGKMRPTPPSDVEGLIKKAEGNLVTISIGSDAGIQRDHELQVFRLGANAKYVGKIRIVEVTPNSAVGQAVGKMNGAMQENDRVANRILGGRELSKGGQVHGSFEEFRAADAAAKSDAYVGLLFISLVAQITGAVFFYLDWSSYPTAVPKPPTAISVPAPGGGAPPAPAPAPPMGGGATVPPMAGGMP